ncbi:MAG: phenylalanine--tRNA ligase subunit beta [Fidelibacterota bacterium]
MLISVKWLKRYVTIDESPEELTDLLTLLGFEAEIAVGRQDIPKVVTARVKTVEKHPNADKLHLCEVTDGNETFQVICGANNVRPNLNVFLAKTGAVLPTGIAINKAKLRGIESFGMLCSERELKLSDDHSGIMELPADVQPGIPFSTYLSENLITLELDITPNRPDALSHYGIAREIAIKTGRPLKPFSDLTPFKPTSTEHSVNIIIDDPEGCPRYIAGVVSNVSVGPSPDWMVELLQAAGQRSINNVVDISNFVLLEMGHPTHIFDYRLIPTKTIQVRRAADKEMFVTLDGEKRTLNREHLLITDGQQSIALAGIMGGANTAVQDDTTTVLIESAYFDPITIRKGSKSLGMLTEASRRFERGADPEGAMTAFRRIVELLQLYAGGKLTSSIVDAYPRKVKPATFPFRLKRLNAIAGIDFDQKSIQETFLALGITFTENDSGSWTCTAPTYRPDLEREIDAIEEVIRIYGYNRIPEPNRYTSIFTSTKTDPQQPVDRTIQSLVGFGFHQCFNNSLQSQRIAALSGKETVKTINPLGEQMSVLRTGLYPGLLQNAQFNVNNGQNTNQLFEVGQIHYRPATGAASLCEEQYISGIAIGNFLEKNVHSAQPPIPFDYFHLKGILEEFAQSVVKRNFIFRDQLFPYFENGQTVAIDNQVVGEIGTFSPVYCRELDIELLGAVGFTLYMDKLQQFLEEKPVYQAIIPYPGIKRDLNFILDEAIQSGEVMRIIESRKYRYLLSIVPTDLFRHESLGPGKKSVVFNFEFRSDSKTLEESEVNPIINEIIDVVTSEFHAKLRSA